MKQFSFTKKGPGRIHNNWGSERRFKNISDIHHEYDLRIQYGCVSNEFIKRWNKYYSGKTVTETSTLRKLYTKFSKLFRK